MSDKCLKSLGAIVARVVLSHHRMRIVVVCLSLSLFAACTGSVTSGEGGSQPGDGDAGTDPGEFGPQPDAEVCDQTVPITVTQTTKIPDVLLVLDKSGSMGDPLGNGGQSKMDVMKQAVQQVLPAQNASIHFGLELYPSDNACGATSPVAPVLPNNANNVVLQVSGVQPGGSTPTYKALDEARSYYGSTQVNPDGRFVLLATDGLPNCNGSDPQNPSNDLTLNAARNLVQAGIKVFVIGFGDVSAADPAFLSALAQAGGTGDFFAANSPQQLQAALASISGTVTQASCSFELETRPQDETKLAVTLDGNDVPRDPSHGTGWDYDASTNTITFYGSTCDQIQSGTGSNVGVDYGCGGVIIGKRGE
jgi:hypothetical protein